MTVASRATARSYDEVMESDDAVAGLPSAELVERLTHAFEAAGDPARTLPMARYMKDQFAFLGIGASDRRSLQRAAWRGAPRPGQAEVVELVDACWAFDEREYQYAGCDYLAAHIGRCSSSLLPDIERWIVTRSWWDTVDVLCRWGAGELVRRDPSLRATMDRWLVSENTWLARSAILHQERWGAAIEEDWLFAACLRRAADREFFIRKAIGWSLRSYAHSSPAAAAAVRRFVAEHDAELSGLSKREALKRVRH